ncbi:MAG: PhnD/SsuA/transferrin family substrate-binding protein [Halothiobacillaceae bacterium]|nr:PhnD/SsuA/transferrin family substrate-binding protein [Halothiobacillaceae bacterium]
MQRPRRKQALPWIFSTLFIASMSLSGAALAANWRFAVPPFLPQTELQAQYAPLVDFLNAATGEHFELVTSSSYLSYWSTATKGGAYDLVLDNAPMIDFRVQRQKFTVLAKITGVISQSVVTGEKSSIFDANELIGKKVAAVASPNLSALAMFQLFPNPIRQPDFIYANDARAAVQMVLENKAVAAIVPTPIAIQFTNLNLVTTTEQTPHLAVAAAPSLPQEVQKKVKQALLNAPQTVLGQKALVSLNTTGFEPASNANYSGYAKWLEGTYGY